MTHAAGILLCVAYNRYSNTVFTHPLELAQVQIPCFLYIIYYIIPGGNCERTLLKVWGCAASAAPRCSTRARRRACTYAGDIVMVQTAMWLPMGLKCLPLRLVAVPGVNLIMIVSVPGASAWLSASRGGGLARSFCRFIELK